MKKLAFTTIVKAVFFKFLFSLGYKIEGEEDNYIKFSMDKLALIFFWEKYSYEINILFAREANHFGIGLILKTFVPNYAGPLFFQEDEIPKIKVILERLLNLFMVHCKPMLRGNDEYMSILEKASRRATEDVTFFYSIVPIKEKAQKAWQEKKFDEVVSLYQSIKDRLNEVETERLKYAQKICKRG